MERQLDNEVNSLLAAGADHSIADADTKWTGLTFGSEGLLTNMTILCAPLVAHIAAMIGCDVILKLLLQHQANMNEMGVGQELLLSRESVERRRQH